VGAAEESHNTNTNIDINMLPETDETSSDDKTFAVELWACGWNAFGQLYFDTEERYRNPKDRHEGMKGRTYEDITTFKKILVDEKKIEFLRGGCSTVLGKFRKNENL
jgi:hypothetical protein